MASIVLHALKTSALQAYQVLHSLTRQQVPLSSAVAYLTVCLTAVIQKVALSVQKDTTSMIAVASATRAAQQLLTAKSAVLAHNALSVLRHSGSLEAVALVFAILTASLVSY